MTRRWSSVGSVAGAAEQQVKPREMRLYYFTTAHFGLVAIRDRRLKIARLHELNDPFEFLSADQSDRERRVLLRQTKATLSETKGLLCFSKSWRNPVLWGHYAEKHRGIALGFDVPSSHAQQISYVNSRSTWPSEIGEPFIHQLLFTKFAHWSYEDEYRVYVHLDTQLNGLYFVDFSESLQLRQIIVGCESMLSRSDIESALADRKKGIEVFKARPAFKSFRMVRNKDERLWA